MPLRVRIRGPSGQSTASFDDNATIETLREQIAESTSLSSFDVKCGYPPKPLDLEQYEPTKLLTELDIKLNGEQLLVTRAEGATPKQATSATPTHQANASQSQQSSAKASPAASQPSKGKQQALKGASTEPAAPLSLTRKENKETSDPPEVFIPDIGGTLVLRIMPDDNSCLFRAISSAVMSDLDAVTELRSIVAETIQADPYTYSKAVLDDKDPDSYCRWIRSQDSWGGQVELVILSQHFGVEICSIDVQSLRVDRYNEGANTRCFVVYSGIHYDTIALSLPGMAPEDDVKQFEAPIKDEVMPRAVDLCKKLQERHYFTDTAGFQIKCNDCGARLVGERGATEHAASTGHYNFGEAA
ncbi:ubiquitin-specific protease otu1 [Knufia fluminis]|uniref:Ubiquitin thioesterase OTU n=1 Tax=Knufia fluminis TaxID=191047 RepID=A0AAN8FFS1_9EURO|nr:ubiquitin-specific protease otu1 [Knufia fluminis]